MDYLDHILAILGIQSFKDEMNVEAEHFKEKLKWKSISFQKAGELQHYKTVIIFVVSSLKPDAKRLLS